MSYSISSYLTSISSYLTSIQMRDPSIKSRWHIILYPCLYAILGHKIAHFLWQKQWYFLAILIGQITRHATLIEIHPGATIGRHLFIDHGAGVVIGETAIIGDECTLYHGVTLGGIAPSINATDQRHIKRHPTLHNKVIIGSGAQILGPITIGEGARVGANAVVLKHVETHTTVTGIPAQAVEHKKDASFSAYGTTLMCHGNPICDKIEALERDIEHLKKQQNSL